MAHDILIVDDEADIRELISGILGDEGFETRVAENAENAAMEIEARRPSLMILDIWLHNSSMDGIEFLKYIKKQYPDLPVIMISGHGNIETAVVSIKMGAFDFIEKPFKADHLIHLVTRATETQRLQRENEELRARALHANQLVGESALIHRLRRTINKIAPTNSRVLITGPAGSGKELAARQLHLQSTFSKGAFVVVNAANIDPNRMEIVLFGSEPDNSATAEGRRPGLFEQAHGGTLFLDEVADMPLKTQAKILRVLLDQTFERVGGNTTVEVNLRVISATNCDLREEIEKGEFREDLYHRLNVVPIKVPPLSERREDIPLLARYFMKRLAIATGLPAREIGPDVMAALQGYDWPGNVRQLRNIIERLLILGGEHVEEMVQSDLLPGEVNSNVSNMLRLNQQGDIMSAPLRKARERFEREYLRAQINRFNGNISRTAEFIGMERSALHRKLKTLGFYSNAGTE